MIHLTNGFFALELPELIWMNQLVRGTIDLVGFRSWYDALRAEEQIALLQHLHLFAQQAGYNEQLFQDAVQAADFSSDHPLIRQVASFRGGYSLECGMEHEWLARQDTADRRRLLTLYVFLFGYAEGRVYANETPESCNHWWHRDLLNERIVQDLLSDPKYYQTSMKDDLKSVGG